MSEGEDEMKELVQIESVQPQPAISIRQMFEQLAEREAAMIRDARERAIQRASKNA